MKSVYLCPHCHANLNPNVKIVLVASHRRRKGLILLSPQPGNYKFIWDDHLGEVITEGVKINYACPVCSTDLRSKANPDFAELYIDSPDNKPKRILFSRKHGTHATFIERGEVFAGYGEDADDFERTNFFGS